MHRLLRAVARPLMAALFIDAGIDALRTPAPRAVVAGPTIDRLAERVPGLPANREHVVRINAGAQVLGGLMLARGIMPRVAAIGLATSLVPTTIGGHGWWRETDPQRKHMQRTQFNKNLAIVGGLLSYAAGPGARPSV